MWKSVAKYSAALPVVLVSTPVMAHVGEHAGMQGWEGVVHFMTQPNHLGILLGAALAVAAAVIWGALRRR